MQTPCKSWLSWGTRVASRLVLVGLVMTSTTWLNSANAKEQANTIAQALGVKITGIKQATGSCGSEQSYPKMYGVGRAMVMESAAPSTPIESGEIKVNATVSVDFYVN